MRSTFKKRFLRSYLKALQFTVPLIIAVAHCKYVLQKTVETVYKETRIIVNSSNVARPFTYDLAMSIKLIILALDLQQGHKTHHSQVLQLFLSKRMFVVSIYNPISLFYTNSS